MTPLLTAGLACTALRERGSGAARVQVRTIGGHGRVDQRLTARKQQQRGRRELGDRLRCTCGAAAGCG